MIQKNKIYNEDNLNTMAKMPDNYVDLIITSPPYEDFGGAGYAAKQKDILFLKFYSDYINKLFKEYHRILKDTGQIYFNIKSKTFNKKKKISFRLWNYISFIKNRWYLFKW